MKAPALPWRRQAEVVIVLAALSATSAAMWGMRLDALNLTLDHDSTPNATQETTPMTGDSSNNNKNNKTEEQHCSDQIGKVENGVVINTMPKYDVEKLLDQRGGAPGKVTVTWRASEGVPEAPVEDTDNATYWLYDYRRSDLKTYIRLEHAVVRHKGLPDERVDIRGELYWTPPDFCGKMRHAKYRKDAAEGGAFVADVALEYCDFGEDPATLWCATPSYCHSNGTHKACVG